MTPLARGTLLHNLAASRSGVAMLEFAFALPIFVTMFVGGSELANYATTRMRVSQVALQIADNAARIGAGSPLAAKTITETDINDVFIGAQLQSGGLNLATNGRVILSDLEPVANPNTTNRYKIVWQRCYGTKTKASDYGTAGQTNLTGMGPAGRLVTAQDDNATMFVQVYYEYKPLISLVWMPTGTFNEIASMAVRDRRDLTTGPGHPQGIYNAEGATVASC